METEEGRKRGVRGAADRRRLTKTVIDGLKPRPAEYLVWDSQVPRFGIRVYPTGAKRYLLRLRMNGRQRWVSIGAHGDPWTPDTARDEAMRLLGDTTKGLDPAAARDFSKGMPTIEEFAERYLREYAEPHKKASTVAEDRAILRRAVLPALGNLRLDTVTRADITRFHLSHKDTPTSANRYVALLSHMFSTAEKWGLRPDGANPCRRVERFAEKKRKRFLSGDELARLGRALGEAAAPKEGSPESPLAIAALRLLILTGARLSEILTLRWEHVDFEHSLLHLPDSKTGERPVYLNAPALEILSKLPRVVGNAHVIPGKLAGTHLTVGGLEHPWRRIRAAAQLDDVRIHDLRHSFASVAVAGGASLPMIGALLGHTKPETTQRYAHLAADPLRATSEAVAARIASAMNGRGQAPAASPVEELKSFRRRRVRPD